MEERVILGRSGLKVSPICFGTWQMGQTFWGKQPEDVLIKAVHTAFESGINFFDTAGAYGDGTAERILGKAFKDLPKDELVVATKVYYHFYPDGRRHPDLSFSYIIKACENSLKRLNIETIGLYQCHFWDPLAPLGEVAEAMDKLKKEGKVKAYGVSNFTIEQLKDIRKYGDFSTLQPYYNLLDTQIEKDLLPYCQTENIGVLVYSPLCHGLLTGKYKGNEEFSDFRKGRPKFRGEEFKKLAQRVRNLDEIAQKYRMSITQLVLTATLMHPLIHCAIVGIKRPEHIEEAVKIMGKTIQREDYFIIRRILTD